MADNVQQQKKPKHDILLMNRHTRAVPAALQVAADPRSEDFGMPTKQHDAAAKDKAGDGSRRVDQVGMEANSEKKIKNSEDDGWTLLSLHLKYSKEHDWNLLQQRNAEKSGQVVQKKPSEDSDIQEVVDPAVVVGYKTLVPERTDQ